MERKLLNHRLFLFLSFALKIKYNGILLSVLHNYYTKHNFLICYIILTYYIRQNENGFIAILRTKLCHLYYSLKFEYEI